ncbi:TIGR02217 family protein [Mesobaculum littorinae]|uniref:TIGR02217 family protein n=1 Tax=Mesobaculum littorinae TaxID=2486419 RepID=A0A438AK35_9RHOB|nr:DUF2460 domain-containing protein [Mesobaculum littorinae]RVV99004.1 TIGR02217 family protein [Mesobaculum littorinae]
MAFHEVRFPADVSRGSMGGPERRTEIVTLANGFEERNSPWAQSRRRYDAGLGLRSLDDVARVVAFFEARGGQLHGFRWKDWADHTSGLPSQAPGPEDQVLGLGDGETQVFRLVKRYGDAAAEYVRDIAKPVAGTVVAAVGGLPMREGAGFEVDTQSGLVTFDRPPPEGTEVTAGFAFDVPVRFDTDRIGVAVDDFRSGQVPALPVVEVRV